MSYRRIVPTFLTAVVLVTAAVGCGNETSAPERATSTTVDTTPAEVVIEAEADRFQTIVAIEQRERWLQAVAVNQWNEAVAANEAAEQARQAEAAQADERESSNGNVGGSDSDGGNGRCGGDLPPCYVMERESGGSPTAFNDGGCGGANCYGKWQFSGEWAGKLGLPQDLSTATEEQQDAAARQLWNGGEGCSNWAAC